MKNQPGAIKTRENQPGTMKTMKTHLEPWKTDLQDTAWESDNFLSLTGGPNWPFRCLDFNLINSTQKWWP